MFYMNQASATSVNAQNARAAAIRLPERHKYALENRMSKFSLLFLTGAALALAACSTTSGTTVVSPASETNQSAASFVPTGKLTILVSIDGFRPDYLGRGVTPVLNELVSTGAVGKMQPSFPSKTFPNHYALITGLHPDRNGIVNNTMEDPEIPGDLFKLSDPTVTLNPAWWDQGRPLWVSASEQGINSATMFWPGSDFVIHGQRPSEYEKFDQKLPDFARVDILLSWLDVPEKERPVLATLYFDIVDTAGHIYGPDSPKTTSSTAQVDAALGRLMDGLKARGLIDSTNIVIVSDHGMAPVSDDQIMSFDDLIEPSMIRVVSTGEFAGLAPVAGYEAEVEAILIGRQAHGECWRKGELPERFAYGSNPRVPAIVCLADTGWRYETSTMKVWRNSHGGHGFDPADPLMAAIFIASGPDIASGVKLETFDNVSVYPFLAELTGIEPVENDGNLADLASALK